MLSVTKKDLRFLAIGQQDRKRSHIPPYEPTKSELALNPLSVEETEALATEVAAPKCDPAFLSSLYKTTKGNPLFVVESTRASFEGDGDQRSVPPQVQA